MNGTGDWHNALKRHFIQDPTSGMTPKQIKDFNDYLAQYKQGVEYGYDAGGWEKHADKDIATIGNEFAAAVKENPDIFKKCCREAKLRYLRIRRRNPPPQAEKGAALIVNIEDKEKIMPMDCEDFYRLLMHEGEVEPLQLNKEELFNLNFHKVKYFSRDSPETNRPRKVLWDWIECMNKEFKLILRPTDPRLKLPFSVNKDSYSAGASA